MRARAGEGGKEEEEADVETWFPAPAGAGNAMKNSLIRQNSAILWDSVEWTRSAKRPGDSTLSIVRGFGDQGEVLWDSPSGAGVRGEQNHRRSANHSSLHPASAAFLGRTHAFTVPLQPPSLGAPPIHSRQIPTVHTSSAFKPHPISHSIPKPLTRNPNRAHISACKSLSAFRKSLRQIFNPFKCFFSKSQETSRAFVN